MKVGNICEEGLHGLKYITLSVDYPTNSEEIVKQLDEIMQDLVRYKSFYFVICNIKITLWLKHQTNRIFLFSDVEVQLAYAMRGVIGDIR